MALTPSDWNSPAAESAWYEYTPVSGSREVCRTDGASFLDDLIGELASRLDSFPSGRAPLDWSGVVVSSSSLPLPGSQAWSLDVLRALFAVLTADGAGSFAAAVARDASAGSISTTTLRAAIWETIPSVVRDAATGAILPAINETTGARRRTAGNTPDRVRLPPNTTPPLLGVAPPAPLAGISGEVCGAPTPDRDLSAVPDNSWLSNPLFLLLVGGAALLLGSAISNRGPKIGKFEPSKKRKF